MTPQQKASLDKLHELQGITQNHLNGIAKHLGQIAEQGVVLPEERLDELWNALDAARARVEKVEAALEKAARAAGLNF